MNATWNNFYKALLMSPEVGEAAGGGSNSLLATPQTGGTTAANAGNGGTSQTATAGGAPAGPTSAQATQGAAATDWRSQLPPELQEDASIKKFTDVSTLAKSYLSAQKMLGADKIPVPTKYTTEEEWKGVYAKLGLPDKVEDYNVKFKEGVSIDEKFSKEFKDKAYAFGVLPKQAQGLADWFSEATATSEQTFKADMDKKFNDGVNELKKEWGNSYDLQLSRAQKVANEMGGPDLVKYFSDAGIGGDKNFIKLLAKVGEAMYGEHKFVEGQNSSGAMSPDELGKEITRLQLDPAYTDKMHPNHKAIVKDVTDLFEKKFNTKK